MSAPLRTLATDAMVCAGGVCTIPDPNTLQKDEPAMPIPALTADERFEILDLIHRYATAIDTRDWSLFRSAFTDDASVDFGFAQWDDSDSFTTFMRENHDPAGRTLHRMSNTVVTDVDPLTVRTYGDAIVLQPDNITGTIANAWYDDELTRTAEGLRIRRRAVHMVSMRAIGPNLAAEL